MILTCNESKLGCFEEGAQYTAEKPMGLSPKFPFIVVTDTYGHLWYAGPLGGIGRYVVRSSDGAMKVTLRKKRKCDLYHKVYEMALFRQCHFVIKKLKRERCGG